MVLEVFNFKYEIDICIPHQNSGISINVYKIDKFN